jgi:S1-C subfamily serine protease
MELLVGPNNSVSGANSYGTGFLIFKDDTCYVVTCRHVIREAGNAEKDNEHFD